MKWIFALLSIGAIVNLSNLWKTKKLRGKDFKTNAIALAVCLTLLFLWPSGSNNSNNTTSSESRETTTKNSTSIEKSQSSGELEFSIDSDTPKNNSASQTNNLESAAKKSNFKDFEYNQEYDAYILSTELNTTFGDKDSIGFFNDEIHEILTQKIQTDKDVIFRAWSDAQGVTTTASLIYFNKDTFNQDWTAQTILTTDTYKYSNGWQTISKFGQYQSSNDKSDSPEIEEKLFNLSMLTKK